MSINTTITLAKYEFDGAIRGSECWYISYVRASTCETSSSGVMVWGLKVYRRMSVAFKAKHRQERYFRKGFAPIVGELVRVRVRGIKKTYYGYLTEHIEGKEASKYIPDVFQNTSEFPTQFHAACRELKRLGHTDVDEHLENIMFCTRRMKWLAVDFGELSNWT